MPGSTLDVNGSGHFTDSVVIGGSTVLDPTNGIKGPIVACVGTPGSTVGPFRSLCVTSAGAAYACANASGCTVAGDWAAQGAPPDAGIPNSIGSAWGTSYTLDTDSTMAANSDTRIPSQKAVKSAIAVSPLNLSIPGMGYLFLPTIFAPSSVNVGLPFLVVSANHIVAMQVVVPYTITVGRFTGYLNTGVSGKTMDFGLYPFVSTGNTTKTVSAGGISAAASNAAFGVLVSPVTVTPGVYWFTYCADSTTINISVVNDGTAFITDLINGWATPASMLGVVSPSTTCTSGVLPSTINFTTLNTLVGSAPAMIMVAP